MMDGVAILLAEDEGLIALDLQLSLEDSGARVIGPFATVEDCLAACERQEFDLAILDVDLKGKEVYPVAERLQNAGVPFVFHTGHADRRELKKRFPTAMVCRKPTAVEDLLAPLEQQAA